MTLNDFVTHLGVAVTIMAIAVYTLITVGFDAYSAFFSVVPAVILLLALLGRKFPKINSR